jgi:hypothetical protein
MRQLRTEITKAWDQGPLSPLGWPLHLILMEDIIDYCYDNQAQPKYDAMLVTPCSQATRLLNRRRTSKQIIDDVIKEAIQVLEEGLASRIQWK